MIHGTERFENREDAGWRLAERVKYVALVDPLVLAIPRGGIEVAAPLGQALGADVDVVLSRKLRAPNQPELALGAVSETGEVFLNDHGNAIVAGGRAYIEEERSRQMAEIERRRRMFREARPQAPMKGRSVIVTDDGIATGSTMIAALRTVRAAGAKEIIVAVPVAPGDTLERIRPLCDRLICLYEPENFWAVGQFYRHFDQVSDERVFDLLRRHGRRSTAGTSIGPDSRHAASR